MLGEIVSRTQAEALVEAGRRPHRRMLELDPGTIRSSYNREPYLVSHRLQDEPLFELDELFALCRRLPAEQVLFRTGVIPPDADLDSSYDAYRGPLTLDSVLTRFEELRAYICINNPERDAKYRPMLETILGEIAAGIDAVGSRVTWFSTYIFVTTRDSVTPYHMDRELNYLLQIRGRKLVFLWDPLDERVLSAAESDRLLACDGGRPAYDPSVEPLAQRFELRPGKGVHHPFIAPHRVHTGPELSVSLAFTFRTRESDASMRAHVFNHKLRSRGMDPRPVGESPMIDHAKSAALRLARLRHVLASR